jgi:hypothetical protein
MAVGWTVAATAGANRPTPCIPIPSNRSYARDKYHLLWDLRELLFETPSLRAFVELVPALLATRTSINIVLR